MRVVAFLLATAVVSFCSCTPEPTNIVLPTVESLGFEWRVPYALTLTSDDHDEPWTGSAVWIDQGTLMFSFHENSGAELDPANGGLLATEMLSYTYNELEGTVRLSLPHGHVTLRWNGIAQRFQGDVFHQDTLSVSMVEEVQQN